MANRNLHDHPFVEEKILIPEIFEDYLKKWLSTFVMSNAYDGIWFFDFFSGTIHNLDDIARSPIRIL